VLYQHFDSKQDLYLALLDEAGNRLRNSVTKAVAGAASGKEQTEMGFKAYFHWVAEDHDAFLLLFGSRASRDEESTAAIRRITAETAHAIAPLIAVDIDPEHQRVLAQGLVGLAEGVSRHLVERGDPSTPSSSASRSPTSPGPVCARCTATPDAVSASRSGRVALRNSVTVPGRSWRKRARGEVVAQLAVRVLRVGGQHGAQLRPWVSPAGR